MQEATPKERMLKRIRKALIEKVENPFPKLEEESNIFREADELLEIQFVQEFTKVKGQFIFCEDVLQFRDNLKNFGLEKNWQHIFCWEKSLMELMDHSIAYAATDDDFENAEVGITSCEALIARTGSILISSAGESGRRLSIYPSTHIVVAYTSQLMFDLSDALVFIKNKHEGNLPSLISTITGPSRTADIEKTLVLGAHGPRELILFLIDDTPLI